MPSTSGDRKGSLPIGLILLTIAYPITHTLVANIPNPFVAQANVALNMIFPVLAGFFLGSVSGGVAGALGTGLSALVSGDVYDALAILPHAAMGVAAGWLGGRRARIPAALTLLLGHCLNLVFYWRFGLLSLDHPETLALGMVTETTIGVVAIMFVIIGLQNRLYREPDQRW